MKRWGDFELLDEIGRGSFGTVYLANHPTLQQQVALKLVPVPSGSAREIEKALEEPRRLASIRHQHVVVVHDARHIDGHVGICMELVRGESLAQLVGRAGRLGPGETIACAMNLCRALSAIHRAAIVHNDVKAQNVMREIGGRIVLMDFGAGRRLLDPTGTTGMFLVGTPAYMAPELFELHSPSPASDIYSLGVLLFYLLTAEYPVEATSMEQFAAAHARRHRRYLGDVRDDIPDSLLAVVDRALEHDPADRYHSCGEMLSDLSGRRHATRGAARHPELGVSVAPASARPGLHAPPGDAASSLRTPLAATARLREASLTNARHWTGEWIGTVAAVTTGVVLVIWFFGFLATQAYNIMFGVSGEFVDESPFKWLEIGFRTLPLPVYYMVAFVTLSVLAGFFWHMVTRFLPGLEGFSTRTSRRLSRTSAQAGLTDEGSLPTLVLLLQVLALVVVYWTFQDLITAFSSPIVVATVEEHALLARSRENRWLVYCGVASALALASGVAWSAIIRRRRPGEGGLAAIVAGIALTAGFVALFAVPWRVYQQSTFERVLFDSVECFVVAEKASRRLLICPTSAEARHPIVNAGDAKLEIPDPPQPMNIFDAVAQNGRLQGAK